MIIVAVVIVVVVVAVVVVAVVVVYKINITIHKFTNGHLTIINTSKYGLEEILTQNMWSVALIQLTGGPRFIHYLI